ncbi:ABC transporter substrate-binding protein [Acidimangrovimonas sediminis]|uniref:ABC transporter substrate-binding protein n=1 Tax=Acidimangrovimonas sediminis TaxID=2056283 RepID=UPI000C80C259|nr:ABC transporter substrate-binding protein [Acidimangrovimonas sediminis]
MTKIHATLAAGAVSLALGAGMLGAGPALALDKVSFGTNWLPEAEHGGYYQAVADGTYAKCGLDVTIVPGGPQVNNRAMMMAGRLTFNMDGNFLQPFQALKEGIPLVVVAADFQKDPQILMTHPGRLKDFKEMKTLPKIFVGDNAYQSLYQWLEQAYGLKASQRAVYTFNAAPFIADKNSAQQGYVTSEPYAVEKQGGFKPDVYLMADLGWNTPATLVEAMQSTLDKHPAWVKCFVEGSAIGWANYLYGDPSKGNAAILKANPEMTQDQIDYSIKAMKDHGIVDSGLSLKEGIGAMSADQIKSFYEKMVKSGVVDKGLDISKVFTTKYSNSGASLPVKKKLTDK